MNRLFCSALLGLALTLTVLPFTAQAAPPPPPGDGLAWGDEDPGSRHFQRQAAILDLSDEQLRTIDALRDAERQATEPYRRQMQESRAAVDALVKVQPFDEAAVRRLAKSKADAAVELQVAHARTRSQIHALLSEEQRALAERLELGPGRRGPDRCRTGRGR